MTKGQEEAERAVDKTLRGHWSDVDPTNYITDCIMQPAHEPLEMLHRQASPHWPTGTPSTPRAYPHIYTCYGWLPVHLPNGSSNSKIWQMASEHGQKVGPNLWARERPQNLSFFLQAVFGEKRSGETVGTWPGVFQDQEKIFKLKISATRGSKKRDAGVSIEGFLRPLAGMMGGLSLQKAVSKDRRRDCYFKCKDNNAKLQGKENQENMTQLKDHDNHPVTIPKTWASTTYPINNSKYLF